MTKEAIAKIDASIAKLHGNDRERAEKEAAFQQWRAMAKLQREAEDAAYANHRQFNHI